jgi:hypothetical protein
MVCPRPRRCQSHDHQTWSKHRPSNTPQKQKLRKMSDEKTKAVKAEVHRLFEAKFIESIDYAT